MTFTINTTAIVRLDAQAGMSLKRTYAT